MGVAITPFKLNVTERQDHSPVSKLPSRKIWNDDGSLWAEHYREGSACRIRFMDIADFCYDPRSTAVECRPATDVPFDVIHHLFHNQVVPLMHSTNGKLVLHGSAVSSGPDAVLFLGRSGVGKSTLASFLATAGFELLCDDATVLSRSDDNLTVAPGHTSVRLWDDSLGAIFPGQSLGIDAMPHTEKKRVTDSPSLRYGKITAQLNAVFHLAEEDSETVDVENMHPDAAFHASLPHLFLFDDKDKTAMAAHFDQLARLCTKVSHFRLRYPRSFRALREVRGEVMRHGLDGQTANEE